MPARSKPARPSRRSEGSAHRRVRIKRGAQAADNAPTPSGDSPKHHGEKLGKAVREAARPADLVEDEP